MSGIAFARTGAAFALGAVILAAVGCGRSKPEDAGPIRVGVLHSLTGTMALSERPVVDAVLLAVDEINAGGGLLGRQVEAVLADGASDPKTFAEQARHLVEEAGVDAIFGCWTSASRKAVRPVVEAAGALLVYPVQYEGVEQSPNIIYTGAAPNQQVMPAASFVLREIGPRVFLVGSDYVFPRTANRILRDHVTALGGEVVGEVYLPLGSDDARPVVDAIEAAKPDAILNTVNGDSNLALFSELRKRGITPDAIPTVSFSIGEPELAAIGPAAMAGDYAAWNYFGSLDTEENRRFVDAFRERHGEASPVSDPMESAYFGVQLWARAVEAAGTPGPAEVLAAMRGQGIVAPQGLVYIDAENGHTWQTVRIGRAREDGEFDVVWESEKPVRPIPYPVFRDRDDWERGLEALYETWGGSWSAPAAKAER